MSGKFTAQGSTHLVNELVVASPHVNLVRQGLETLGVEMARRDDSPALGLSRLRLAGPQLIGETAKDRDSPLDGILAELRQYFREGYNGWVPAFGKNREVETVGGAHVISGGGSELPVSPAAGPEALAGGWTHRSLSGNAYVIPEPELGDDGQAAHGGPRALIDGLTRPSGHQGRGATVAVCDTKLWDGGALTGGYLAAPGALLQEAELPFTAGHATFITGTILRNAPGAAITIQPTLDNHARGTSWQLAIDLIELADRGVDVINVSAGFFTGDDEPALAVTTALRLIGRRTVVVAAAGNHGLDAASPRRPMWPAAYDEVVSVGALTPRGARAPFSPNAPWVRLMAPGVNVVSNYFGKEVSVMDPGSGRTVNYGGVAAWSGTSFAAAWVSGLIAGRIRRGRVDAPEAVRQLTEAARIGTTAARLPDNGSAGRPHPCTTE
jgi:subtilisin family serine protease